MEIASFPATIDIWEKGESRNVSISSLEDDQLLYEFAFAFEALDNGGDNHKCEALHLEINRRMKQGRNHGR